MKNARTRVLLTAAEAYPEYERGVLAAQSEIRGCFRVFDPRTRLRSPEALAVGETWFDLILHALRRGVAIDLVISDFDPIGAPDLHRATWRTVRLLMAARELAGPQARLTVTPALHPARTGRLQAALFAPTILSRLRAHARNLNALDPATRAERLNELPGLRPSLIVGRDGRVRPRLFPLPRLIPATHHQKLAVFDRKVLFVGGLDLDDRRYDTADHQRSAEQTWHDVMLRMEGHVVAEALAHLDSFRDVTAGRRRPPPQRRLLRTLSRARKVSAPFIGPRPVTTEILSAHLSLIPRAQRLIYVETQFLRDRRLAQVLARAATANPALTMILILPAAPEDVAFGDNMGVDARLGEYLQARCLRILRKGFGRRLFVGGAAQPRRARSRTVLGRDTALGAPIIYIHAKVSIFDTRWAIVSSANLNGRSLRWDTECGVFLNSEGTVTDLRRRLMAHWLPDHADHTHFDEATAVSAWTALARANAARPPEDRQGFLLPYEIGPGERFGQPAAGLPDELV